jgi:diguanylate cyclase (GGDEF)-like protein
MISDLRERFGRSTLLHGRVQQSLWVEMVLAATAASALMAVVSGAVVLSLGVSRLQKESAELQRKLSTALTSYQPLYSLQRELQQATSSRQALAALVIDRRGVVLAASNNALVGLTMGQVLHLPAQHRLQALFRDCPSLSTQLACLNREAEVFTGPMPLIGGDAALAMRPYPLALEGGQRFGERATLITVSDAQPAARQALSYTLIVFLAGLLPLLAGCAGLILRLRQRLIPELLRLAQVDALSGVLNRRAFQETATDLLQRARQIGQPMTLALIDVDHFKAINDTYGHDAGDQVIRQVSELLGRSVRSADLVGRLGGDEFVLLVQLPNEAANQMLERIHEQVRSTDMAVGEKKPVWVSLSVGLASSTGHAGYELNALMTAADAALYVAKDRGRAQVVNLELERERSKGRRRSPSRPGGWEIRGA